jgi:sigma-B regulation protein RsbU (phosphoserine phosphatase)
MRFGLALRWFAALVLSACACAPLSRGQSFDLSRDHEPLVSLDGLWHFHPGDSPRTPSQLGLPESFAWAQSAFNDAAWPLLRSNRSWSTQGYPALSGYGWYRFTLSIPPSQEPASLMLAPIVTSYEVYVDGQLVGKSGKMPPTMIPNARISHQVFPLTRAASRNAQTLHVAIRVWHSPLWSTYVGGGPYEGGNLAGDRSFVVREKSLQQVARNVTFVDYYAYSIAAALVGLAILCLFLIRKAEREYLWFAVMLLAQAADSALNVSKEIYAFPPTPIFDLFDGVLAGLNIFAAFCFFSKVLNARPRLFGRGLLTMVVLSPFAGVLYWPGLASGGASEVLQLLLLIPAVLWIFWLLGKRAIGGNLDAQLLLFPTLLDIGFYVADNIAIVLAQVGWSHAPRILDTPVSLPPFTMRPAILLHLIFLLAMCVFLILRFTRARRREAWLAGEFEAARQIQLVLLPDQLDQCAGFRVSCIYQPAEQVGGDFFQQIGDGCCGMLIVVGDVSGKGLPAAMLVSVLVGAIRTEAAHTTDPINLLNCLNERMMGRAHGGFTTCLAAHISSTGLVTLANAGHLSPYLNGEELAIPGSLPLGILDHPDYDCCTAQLLIGDQLTFVSDGVVEAQSKSASNSHSKAPDLFGFDRTRQLSNQPATVIADAARAFGQTDDITVVTLEFTGPAIL